MRRFGRLFLIVGFAFSAPAHAAINYNASKSNTGNVTAKCHNGSSHMAVKGCGVPQNTSGAHSGKRIYKPVQ
jgi:hypothetical protein